MPSNLMALQQEEFHPTLLDEQILYARISPFKNIANLAEVGVVSQYSCETISMTNVSVKESDRDLETLVKEVIEIIRPALQADEGDVVLHEVNEKTGEVTVELIGACVSCDSSDQTMKAGIERILKERVPEITSVHNLGEAISDEGTAVTL